MLDKILIQDDNPPLLSKVLNKYLGLIQVSAHPTFTAIELLICLHIRPSRQEERWEFLGEHSALLDLLDEEAGDGVLLERQVVVAVHVRQLPDAVGICICVGRFSKTAFCNY